MPLTKVYKSEPEPFTAKGISVLLKARTLALGLPKERIAEVLEIVQHKTQEKNGPDIFP